MSNSELGRMPKFPGFVQNPVGFGTSPINISFLDTEKFHYYYLYHEAPPKPGWFWERFTWPGFETGAADIFYMRRIIMAERFLDCLGEACPVPLIKAQKELETMAAGDVLTMNIDHTCAMKNVPDWARGQGYNVDIEEVGEGEWDIIIEKV
jgi:TusA-related sulfurtransferase